MTTTERHELLAWLGPAADQLAPDQIDRVSREADAIAARYPDPDETEERDVALSVAVQYLLHEITPQQVREEYAAARRQERRTKAAAVQMALLLDADGITEVNAAELAGINRRTLRRAKRITQEGL